MRCPGPAFLLAVGCGPLSALQGVGGCGVRWLLPALHPGGPPWGLCHPLGQVPPDPSVPSPRGHHREAYWPESGIPLGLGVGAESPSWLQPRGGR